MLMPEKMNRVLIVGSKENMKKTIDVLYQTEAIHLVDFPAEEQGFTLGQPLTEASEASQKLLKLRALEKDMELTEDGCDMKVVDACKLRSECDQNIKELDSKLSVVVEKRVQAQTRLSDIQNDRKALEPFLAIDIPIDLYKGYNTLGVSSGYVKSDPSAQVRQASADAEVFASKDGKFIAAFYPKKDAAEVVKALMQNGFVEVPAPNGTGLPAARMKQLDDETVSLEKTMEETSKTLEELRKDYGCAVNATDEQLAIEVQVAETPLRFGATQHAFIIDGWVPESDYEALRSKIETETAGKVNIEVLETATRHESHEHDTQHIELVDYGQKDVAPTKQANGKTVRKFEYLTEMLSTPKYNEIDPTVILALTFPLFFGLMIGDMGYGIAFASLGALGLSKCKSPEWRTIATMLFFGGLWATFFGFVLFGEALGMHFGPVWEGGATAAAYPYGNELTWSYIFHYNLPHIGIFSKLVDVKMLLFISMMIGFVHLALGFGLGFYNKSVRFGLKHAVMEKFSWIMILVGGWFMLIWLIDVLIQPIAWMGFPLLQYYIYIALALILPGTIMAYLGEGGGAILELPGLMSNVLSYTRLTAIAMSKAGLALAFNTLAFSIIIDVSGTVDPVMAIIAMVVFVVGQLMVFILGIISAGLHAVRLHYVELFQKFYEGGGSKFDPLRIVRKWTSEKAGE
ncbi:MAG: V-type ATP synthase subunit I [Methanomassiliicoccales archaeon PtaU1.Bin124]|nr:MAG: V-type ATP synthase subunit I [Methanomassiliicoccales archaeon PtaU1.Bin124]